MPQILQPPRNLFERYEQGGLRRALLARILQDTQDVVDSYESLDTVSEATGIPREELESMADRALVELAEAYEALQGGPE